VNQGHCHPKIMQAMLDQAHKVTLTSRAFRNDQLPFLCRDLCELTGMDTVLPMNSGAEAVETALKAARKWGYQVKGIAPQKAEIIACANNFHGRTIAIVSMSTDEQYRDGFGPFTPGFTVIPYGDLEALRKAITPNTCAFLVEPIQGEAGIVIPRKGFLEEAAALCQKQRVLFMADEIQSGLGRTGKMFAFQHENVRPDVVIVGKALSGGFLPVSAVVARKEVLAVFKPGDHGSTFGGNPLACAVARASLKVLVDEKLVERSAELGEYLLGKLRTIKAPHIVDVRGRGLWIGVELTGAARPYCEKLKAEGILCKETHDHVIRVAPPLVITKDEIDWAFDRFKKVLG
jgi:ornithine--oxo-acid transaminase